MTTVHGPPALTLGGPLAANCETCRSPRLHDCHTAGGKTCAPHAARVKAAPPAEVAAASDLVIVSLGDKTALAQLLDVNAAAVEVRLWRPSAQAFASARLLPRSAVLRLAPKDAAATQMARAELGVEARSEGTIGAFRKAVAPGHSPTEPTASEVARPADPWSRERTRDDDARKGW